MPASFSRRNSTSVTATLSEALPVTVMVSLVCRELAAGEEMVTVGGVKSGGGTPSCVTVKVFPAIFNLAVRELAPGFGSYDKTTSPLPCPDVPARMPSQVAPAVVIVASQGQPSVAVTMMAGERPPLGSNDRLAGLRA